jgi:hypothetical protein
VTGGKTITARISIGSLFMVTVMIVSALTVYAVKGMAVDQEGEKKPKKPRFDKGEMTIRDNDTGLMWALSGSLSDTTYSWGAAVEYVDELNQERFGGYFDWRLPTREELLSLVQEAQRRGFDGRTPERAVSDGLRQIGILKIQPSEYWSSTVNLYDASEVWFVNMRDGTSGTGEKTLYLYVWPVRAFR